MLQVNWQEDLVIFIALQRGNTGDSAGRLKMREWKMRYGTKCKGGKCRSRLAVWKAEPILYNDTALSYFLKIVSKLLSE